MRRLFLLTVVTGFLAFAPATLASADDSYNTDVPTQCQVSVPSTEVGARVVLNVVVSASGNVDPTGTVEVTVSKRAKVARAAQSVAAAPWTTTVRYEGSPLRIVGPRLSKGDHVASIRFVPDAGLFLGCSDTVRFRVGSQAVGGEDDLAGDGDALPDTGGPDLLWLLLGLGLVTVGGAVVGGSRLRA